MTTNNRKTLLQYWTTRYLATLFLGLIIIAFVSVIWVRHTTLENRLEKLHFLTEIIANRFVENATPEGNLFNRLIENEKIPEIEGNPAIFLVNVKGQIITKRISQPTLHIRSIPLPILENKNEIQKVNFLNKKNSYYFIKTPIIADQFTFGWVVIIQSEKELKNVNEEYRLLAIMLISLAILGWLAIYFLSRKLSRPIQQVALAAKQVADGNYDLKLPSEIKEQEVFELVQSFKEMTEKLKRLEELRAELLAGVTHELKTPITSISGLLQAIKDDVVTGKEAKEFLQISLKEVARMQKMVGDLLEFNTFAANAVPIKNDVYSVNEMVNEIAHQWEIVQEDNSISVAVTKLPNDISVIVDPMRLQQIFENLLNNAKQAMDGKGRVCVQIYEKDHIIAIDVKDEGCGIPIEEQPFVFERFFRGKGKKHKFRGLGLGLSFSKMMAKTMGGDLILKESSETGTVFTVTLPISRNN